MTCGNTNLFVGFSSNAMVPGINFIIIVGRFPSIAIKWLIGVNCILISTTLKISHLVHVPSLAKMTCPFIFSPSARITRKFSFRGVA